MDYDPLTRKLQETWNIIEHREKKLIREWSDEEMQQFYRNEKNPWKQKEEDLIAKGVTPNPVETVSGTFEWNGEFWVNVENHDQKWQNMVKQPDGFVGMNSGTPVDKSWLKDVGNYALETEVTEVTKDEHEANMRRAMSSQGITTRKLSPDDLEHREAVKRWALEHQHEGFDAYDILYLGPDYTAVYNTREPDPETGRQGSYYIIQQDIFVSPEEVRKMAGK